MTIDNLPISVKIDAMKRIAAHKAGQANGSPEFFAEIEKHLDLIAMAQLANMTPINENLLGFALILQAELKRLKG